MMLIRSARARVALITALICALVLGAFSAAAWWKLREARMEALDRELEGAGNSLALSARLSLASSVAERTLDQRLGMDRAQIFERFRRGTNSGGTGEGRGLGIGLSLAREIAAAHGGDLTLEAGATTTFALRLPAIGAAV